MGLAWDVDFSDRPPMAPQPDPTPLHLPFALSDFPPSLITADDDLVDLDVVRAAVPDTAWPLHPGAQVQGGEVVFRRVPCQRGVTMNSVVEIDGEPKFFLTMSPESATRSSCTSCRRAASHSLLTTDSRGLLFTRGCRGR